MTMNEPYISLDLSLGSRQECNLANTSIAYSYISYFNHRYQQQ